MIENVSTQLTVFHCFAHCLLPGRAFAPLYVLLFLEKEAEIGGRALARSEYFTKVHEYHEEFGGNYLVSGQCWQAIISFILVDIVLFENPRLSYTYPLIHVTYS